MSEEDVKTPEAAEPKSKPKAEKFASPKVWGEKE